MQIDEPWTVREERGFTWWGAWIRQRVWAGPATRSAGETLWHVRARTPVFRDQPDEPATYARVNEWNALWPMGAMAYDPDDGTISARTGAFLYAGVDPWLETFLLMAVGLQASLAWLAAETGEGVGPRDDDPHPAAGPRRDPDDMLNLAGSTPEGAIADHGLDPAVGGDGRSRPRASPRSFDADDEMLVAILPLAGRDRGCGCSGPRTTRCSGRARWPAWSCRGRWGRSGAPGSRTRSTWPRRPTGRARSGRTRSGRGPSRTAAWRTARSSRRCCWAAATRTPRS